MQRLPYSPDTCHEIIWSPKASASQTSTCHPGFELEVGTVEGPYKENTKLKILRGKKGIKKILI